MPWSCYEANNVLFLQKYNISSNYKIILLLDEDLSDHYATYVRNITKTVKPTEVITEDSGHIITG